MSMAKLDNALNLMRDGAGFKERIRLSYLIRESSECEVEPRGKKGNGRKSARSVFNFLSFFFCLTFFLAVILGWIRTSLHCLNRSKKGYVKICGLELLCLSCLSNNTWLWFFWFFVP